MRSRRATPRRPPQRPPPRRARSRGRAPARARRRRRARRPARGRGRRWRPSRGSSHRGLASFAVLRVALALAAVAAAALTAACGGSAKRSGSGHVSLSLASPGDGAVVRAAVVEVRGTVRPRGAAVEVAGRPAAVSGGAFDVVVPLDTGANVLDVAAPAPGAPPPLAALRGRRDA